MRKEWKRVLVVLLAFCMLLGNGICMRAFAEESDSDPTVKWTEPQTTVDENEIVRVFITLDDPSVLATDRSRMKIGTPAAAAYEKQLLESQHKLERNIERSIGSKLDVVWNLTLTCNAISANVRYGDLETIRHLPGVQSAEPVQNYEYTPVEDRELQNTSAAISELTTSNANHSNYYGAGMKIAFIDSGLDVEHISFNEDAYLHAVDPEGTRPLRASQIDEETLNSLKAKQYLPTLTAEDTYVSEKIPFVFNYAAKSTDVSHISQNHGSSVAGTAAANRYIKTEDGEYLDAVQNGYTVGIAPDAQIYVMSMGDTASSDDIIAALDDALRMQCDAINISCGAPFGSTFSFGTNPDKLLLALDCVSCTDAIVTISAGNEGTCLSWDNPIYKRLDGFQVQTVSSPGTAVNSLCVAASTGWNDAESGNAEMTEYSSWGVPSSLLMKPEIVAPGDVYTVIGKTQAGSDNYLPYDDVMGTSFSAPGMSGASALIGEYLNNSPILNIMPRRTAVQSLLMSTASPMMKDGRYYPILQQGAGLVDLDAALSAKTVLVMSSEDETLTAITNAASDGKVKVELGDDPERTGDYTYSFRIYNMSNETVYFDSPYTDAFTQDYDYLYDINGNVESGPYMSQTTTYAQRSFGYIWTPSEVLADDPDYGTEYVYDLNGDNVVNDLDVRALLDYLAGNLQAEDISLRDADMDEDGIITSHDAKQLLDYVEEHPSNYVPCGGYADVSIRFHFDVNTSIYTAGAFIEGFTHLTEQGGVTHSIPILGYFGDWTEPSMFTDYDLQIWHRTSFGTEDGRGYNANLNNGIPPIAPPVDAFNAFHVRNIYRLNRTASATVSAVFELYEPAGAEKQLLQMVALNTIHLANTCFYPQTQTILDMSGTGFSMETDTPLRFVFFAIPEYTALKYNYEHGIRNGSSGSYSAELSDASLTDLLNSGHLKNGCRQTHELSREDWYTCPVENSPGNNTTCTGPITDVPHERSTLPESSTSLNTIVNTHIVKYAYLDLVQSVSSANGVIEVKYDPHQAVYNGLSTDPGCTAVHVDEENGVIRLVYASKEELNADDVLALRFGVRPCSQPEATVTVCERNEEYSLSETTTATLYGSHNMTFGNVEWRQQGNGWAAFALFRCSECNDSFYVEMPIVNVKTDALKRTIYTATLIAEESPDGQEHTATYTVGQQKARFPFVRPIEPPRPIHPRDPVSSWNPIF